MGESDEDQTATDGGLDAAEAEELAALRTELDQLWDEVDGVEERLDEKTVSRSDLESELKRYVRKRQRRGHARGWGPYLVLVYGTIMTLGAFFYLEGLWAVLAMVVVWLSTLGLYALMIILGIATRGISTVGRLRDVASSLRS